MHELFNEEDKRKKMFELYNRAHKRLSDVINGINYIHEVNDFLTISNDISIDIAGIIVCIHDLLVEETLDDAQTYIYCFTKKWRNALTKYLESLIYLLAYNGNPKKICEMKKIMDENLPNFFKKTVERKQEFDILLKRLKIKKSPN